MVLFVSTSTLLYQPPPPNDEALRAIEVPYFSTGSNQLYSYASEPLPFELPAGPYQLRYELLPGFEDGGDVFSYRIKFTLVPNPEPKSQILKSDHAGMTARTVLRTGVSGRKEGRDAP